MRTMLYCSWLASLASPTSPTETQLRADGFDRHAVQIRDVLNQAVGINVIIAGADLDVARRQDEIAVVDRVHHVHHAQLAREQLVGIDIDHGLPVLAAEHRRDFRALHHRDLIADLELREIVKLGFVQALALDRDQAHRKAGGVELQHQRRQRSGRQALQIGQGQIRQLRHVRIGVGAGLEIHLDDADAQQRAGLHVIDAAGLGEEAFQWIGDVHFDVLRRHAVVKRRHHHFRQVDGRKQIHRHAGKSVDADDRQRQADDHNEIRVANGKTWHGAAPAASAVLQRSDIASARSSWVGLAGPLSGRCDR